MGSLGNPRTGPSSHQDEDISILNQKHPMMHCIDVHWRSFSSSNDVVPCVALQTEQAGGGPADLRSVHRGPAGAHRLAVQGGAADG